MPTPSQRRRQFLKRPAYVLGLLLFLPLCRPIASATEVYAYHGFDYTYADGIYTTNDYVSGDFTTSSLLPPWLMGYSTPPLTYAFGDGYFDWTNTNSTLESFYIYTDAYGSIDYAVIEVEADFTIPNGPEVYGGIAVGFEPGAGDAASIYFDGLPAGSGYNHLQGKWGPNFDPPDTPEPASAVLTSAALLAFAFLARKRIAQGMRQSPQMHR